MRKYTKITYHTILLSLKSFIIISIVIVIVIVVTIVFFIQINDSILFILILSDQITDILVSLLKFHFIHTFALIPMQESLSFVHFCKLCADSLEDSFDRSRVCHKCSSNG